MTWQVQYRQEFMLIISFSVGQLRIDRRFVALMYEQCSTSINIPGIGSNALASPFEPLRARRVASLAIEHWGTCPQRFKKKST